jgi:hypothetical protein
LLEAIGLACRAGLAHIQRAAILGPMIERVLRVPSSFGEAAELDRRDVAAMSFEERISGVERLRRIWFGEDRAQSRLDRVLVSADLSPRTIRRGTRERATSPVPLQARARSKR